MAMSRILITGAGGYVGRRIVAALAGKADVMALDRRALPGMETLVCDLSDASTVKQAVATARATHLIHSAWYVEHGKFWTAPENRDWVGYSQNLLHAFHDGGGRYALGLGTCVEYAPQDGALDEATAIVAPETLYAQCKDDFHRWAQTFAQDSGLVFGWARIFFPIGLDEPPQRLVASVARHLIAGTPAPCSNGAGVRDFLDVRDTGAAVAAIALAEGHGIYNVGSGQGVTIAQVARRLGELAGKPALVEIGALPDRPGDPPSLVARVERLAATGFHRVHNLDQTLADTLAWWRDHP